MNIEIHTSNPSALLAKIKKDITNMKVKTWSIVLDSNGDEFLTHNPQQWNNKALLEP